MKKAFSIIFFFFAIVMMGNTVQAQDVSFKKSSEWTYLYTVDGVNFYYCVKELSDKETGTVREYVLLKIQNTNDREVDVQWNQILYYNDKCFNCGKDFRDEYVRKVTVGGNSTREGEVNGDKTLKIFSRFVNKESQGKMLTNFSLEKIEVK